MCVCLWVCARGGGGWCRAQACACSSVALLIQHVTHRHIAIWGFWLHRTFRHYLINGTIFVKKVTDYKMGILIFSTFIWDISHSKRNSAWYCHKCETVFIKITRYLCRVLIKTDFSRQIFAKSSNIKSHQSPSSGSRVVPCGRTDRHDEAKCRFSQFCERA